MRSLIALSVIVLALGCGDPPDTTPIDRPVITFVDGPTPVVEGSLLAVYGERLENLGSDPGLRVQGPIDTTLPLEREGDDGELLFRATATLVTLLGPGTHSVQLTAVGAFDSNRYPLVLEVSRSLPIEMVQAPSGDYHRNDVGIVTGAGFLEPTEGVVEARFEGTFAVEGGTVTRPVDATLPVLPAELFARDRGVVRLSTAIGGMEPGTFTGTVQLSSRAVSGEASSSASLSISLRFGLPELHGIDPGVAFLEQVVTVRGAGFLGGPTEPDEFTLIRLSGELTPERGAPTTFGPQEFAGFTWVSGREVRGVVRARVDGSDLVSELFGAQRGRLVGTATPVVLKGTQELVGATVPFDFSIGGMRQIVYLKFLPGFYESLSRFGLAAAEGLIEDLVVARIEDIYARWGIDVRLDVPQDYSDNGYATIEIGGTDPNGVGLFGYDNTPGKDVNNLRLHDAIGGANAETQAGGYPGYGGVFVESLLYFSTRPELPGRRPPSSPDPDPVFDEIFDPVRRRAATQAELLGDAGGARALEVRRALEALASMIGETTAHELGHSMGLADPYGPSLVFHNSFDGDGCLMDNGGNRPVGERANQPGFALSRLCHDAPRYLDELFGVVE